MSRLTYYLDVENESQKRLLLLTRHIVVWNTYLYVCSSSVHLIDR